MQNEISPNIIETTWNFSEAGQVKGPMDGEGGVVKRTAEKLALYGLDVPSVADFIQKLTTHTTMSWNQDQTYSGRRY